MDRGGCWGRWGGCEVEQGMFGQTGGCKVGLEMFKPIGDVGRTEKGRRGFAI